MLGIPNKLEDNIEVDVALNFPISSFAPKRKSTTPNIILTVDFSNEKNVRHVWENGRMRLKNPCEKLERIDCFSSLLLDIVSCYEMDRNFPAAGNIY